MGYRDRAPGYFEMWPKDVGMPPRGDKEGKDVRVSMTIASLASTGTSHQHSSVRNSVH